MKNVSRAATAGLCAATLILPMGSAAAKGGGDEVSNEGSCARTTDWELKAKARDGGIEVEWEVDSNRAGQQWRWRLRHNGVRFAKGVATTTGRSGSFSVERRATNLPGVDVFGGRAKNLKTGEVCLGTLRF